MAYYVSVHILVCVIIICIYIDFWLFVFRGVVIFQITHSRDTGAATIPMRPMLLKLWVDFHRALVHHLHLE